MKYFWFISIPIVSYFLWNALSTSQSFVTSPADEKPIALSLSPTNPLKSTAKDHVNIPVDQEKRAVIETKANIERAITEGEEFTSQSMNSDIFEDRETRATALQERKLKVLSHWDFYEGAPNEFLDDHSILGTYIGQLDDKQSSITITLTGEPSNDSYSGNVSIKIIAGDSQVTTHATTTTSSFKNNLKIDRRTNTLLLRPHKNSRYVFQLVFDQSNDRIAGNIYLSQGEQNITPFQTFTASRE